MRDPTRDVARGITVLEMEYGNHMSSLPHAPIGASTMTYADTVFPMFIFLAGMGPPSPGRSLCTIGHGMAYNTLRVMDRSWLESTKPWKLRPFGVLQRIGTAGLLASLSPAPNRPAGFVFPAAATSLWIYLSIAVYGPQPRPFRVPNESTQSRIDKVIVKLLAPGRLYMYRPDYDPEGLLGSLMAAVSMWFARWSQINHLALDEAMITSLSLMSFGYLFGYAFPRTCPVSKPYYTLSFALSSSGFSLLKYTLYKVAMPYIPSPAVHVLASLGSKSLEVFFTSAVLDRIGFHAKVKRLVAKFTSRAVIIEGVATTVANVLLASLAVFYVRAGWSLRLL